MYAYLPVKSDSNYYNSEAFKQILNYLKYNFSSCEMTEKKARLSIRIRDVKNIKEALKICKDISADKKALINQQ